MDLLLQKMVNEPEYPHKGSLTATVLAAQSPINALVTWPNRSGAIPRDHHVGESPLVDHGPEAIQLSTLLSSQAATSAPMDLLGKLANRFTWIQTLGQKSHLRVTGRL